MTLRFKHGRLTILLFSDPLTPISTLKSELLDVLRERYPAGLPPSSTSLGTKNIEIPESIHDVAFGVPVDIYEMSKGWEELNTGGAAGGMKESPKSLGLKDGSCLAFRFAGEEEGDEDDLFSVEWPDYEELYGERDLDMEVDREDGDSGEEGVEEEYDEEERSGDDMM